MGRRTVLLVAAVLIAALGAGLVLIYVHDVNQKVKAREAPEQILVAKKIIPAGTTGAAASAEGDLEFLKVAAGVPLAERRRDGIAADRRSLDLASTQQPGHSRQGGRHIDAHDKPRSAIE